MTALTFGDAVSTAKPSPATSRKMPRRFRHVFAASASRSAASSGMALGRENFRLHEQGRLCPSRQCKDGGKTHHLINLLGHGFRVDSHVFQPGAARDQA